MSTNWSIPKTNFISAANDLRKCLASGKKAKLIKEYNENCNYPIREDLKIKQDFRDWRSTGANMYTRQEILDSNKSDFEKYLMLNYHNCFGTPEAIDTYYKTGKPSKDNFRSCGRSHLVKITDMIKFWIDSNDQSELQRIDIFTKQYITLETAEQKQFYDNFTPIQGYVRKPKIFKHKLWVVEMINDKYEQPPIPKYQKITMSIINALLYPLKYIPKRNVLIMPEYKVITYRVGGVTNGYAIEIHKPNKFRINLGF